MRLMLILVVCTLMISTIDLSQNFVFAQNLPLHSSLHALPAQDKSTSTPASGSNDESLSSDDNDSNDSNVDETSSSSGSADDDNNSE